MIPESLMTLPGADGAGSQRQSLTDAGPRQCGRTALEGADSHPVKPSGVHGLTSGSRRSPRSADQSSASARDLGRESCRNDAAFGDQAAAVPSVV